MRLRFYQNKHTLGRDSLACALTEWMMKDVPCVGDTPWIWPMLGAPTEYTAVFFKSFKEAALGMGIKLSGKLWRGARKQG
jgi:hypothetical protein